MHQVSHRPVIRVRAINMGCERHHPIVSVSAQALQQRTRPGKQALIVAKGPTFVGDCNPYRLGASTHKCLKLSQGMLIADRGESCRSARSHTCCSTLSKTLEKGVHMLARKSISA